MNGIGIVEWRDHGLTSSYPLAGIMEPNDVFVDASFVQFDNFIPQLLTAAINNDGVVFTLLFDDGNFVLSVSSADCVEGTVLILRGTNRFYGQLVCGPGIGTILNTKKGTTLTINTNFEPITVRSIPSTAGLFSLQHLSQDITITTDDAQRFNFTGPDIITWNTVSKPNKVQYLTLSPNVLYSVTDQKKIIAVDPIGKTFTTMFEVPIACTCIVAAIVGDAMKLIGTVGGTFYDLTTVPPTQFSASLDESILAMSFVSINGTNRLYALTPTKLYTLDLNNPDPLLASNGILYKAGTGLLGVDLNVCIYTSPGPLDSSGNQLSNLLYSYDNRVGQTLQALNVTPDPTDTSSAYQKPIVGMATLHGVTYIAIVDGVGNSIYKLDLASGIATLVFSLPFTLYTGKLIGLTTGNAAQVSIPDITPLKTVNGVAPVNNAIQLNTNGLIQIEQTNVDELTLKLAVDIVNTNITPSTTYE